MSGELQTPATLPRRKNPDTHQIGGCVGRRAGVDACPWIRIPDRPGRSSVNTRGHRGSISPDDGHSKLSGYQIIMWRRVKRRYIPTKLHGITPGRRREKPEPSQSVLYFREAGNHTVRPGQYSFQEI